MSDWVTVYEFPLQDDLSAVAAFIRRHQLPMRISEERNHQCVATLAPQLAEPMRQLLQRWHAGEVDLEKISVHVYEEQPSDMQPPDLQGSDVAQSTGKSVAGDPAGPVDTTSRQEPVSGEPSISEVPYSVIPQWRLGQTPVSLLLIVLCFIGWALLSQGWVKGLVIFPQQAGDFDFGQSSLAAHLAQGEYWRLWSPAMVHFSLPHALFNSLGIWIVGRSLEARAGSWLFALLVFISAPVSNLVQYFWSPQVLFGGMSGVVYALVGAAFVVQRWVPGWRDVPPSLIWVAVIWLLVCMSGVVDYFISGGIANAAHIAGFASGLILGLLFCLAGGARRFAPQARPVKNARETF
ncbi:rhomboid family intramembrane serine protease [Microbulbifer aggregans]|uniref:rhomboid family intramembrane serine protease n=1 Tax=Microbulbifer aggregans TaxID=1769779 RepID=UPI001CFDF836|nr:rhomboid family intramembrane serine protease [Microbulbifer aggregans]